MKKLNILPLCALTLALIVASGCGPKRPEEMPKTYPLCIVVKQAGAPMKDVAVSLASEDAQGRWTTAGTTDESGTAQMRTICRGYVESGAPEGEHKVLLSAKLEKPDAAKAPSETEMRNMTEEERKARAVSRDEYLKKRKEAAIFPREFSSIKDTPFSVTVEKGAKVVEIEVQDAD